MYIRHFVVSIVCIGFLPHQYQRETAELRHAHILRARTWAKQNKQTKHPEIPGHPPILLNPITMKYKGKHCVESKPAFQQRPFRIICRCCINKHQSHRSEIWNTSQMITVRKLNSVFFFTAKRIDTPSLNWNGMEHSNVFTILWNYHKTYFNNHQSIKC